MDFEDLKANGRVISRSQVFGRSYPIIDVFALLFNAVLAICFSWATSKHSIESLEHECVFINSVLCRADVCALRLVDRPYLLVEWIATSRSRCKPDTVFYKPTVIQVHFIQVTILNL